jgi:hypothetical protein
MTRKATVYAHDGASSPAASNRLCWHSRTSKGADNDAVKDPNWTC